MCKHVWYFTCYHLNQWQVWEWHDRLHWKQKYVTPRGAGREGRPRSVVCFWFPSADKNSCSTRAGTVSTYCLQLRKETGKRTMHLNGSQSMCVGVSAYTQECTNICIREVTRIIYRIPKNICAVHCIQ